MNTTKIAQQLAIALTLGVSACAHAQLLGGGLGGSVGGMVGGGLGRMGDLDASSMVRGGGRLDADVAGSARGMANRTAERVREARPEPQAADAAAGRLAPLRAAGQDGTGKGSSALHRLPDAAGTVSATVAGTGALSQRSEAGRTGAAGATGSGEGGAGLGLDAAGAASLAGDAAVAAGASAGALRGQAGRAQAAGQRGAAEAADQAHTGLRAGTELARGGAATLNGAAAGSGSGSASASGSGSGSGKVDKSSPARGSGSASLSLDASASARGRSGGAD